MALDSSGETEAMTGDHLESALDDLEDGEIASDDEEKEESVVEQTPEIKAEPVNNEPEKEPKKSKENDDRRKDRKDRKRKRPGEEAENRRKRRWKDDERSRREDHRRPEGKENEIEKKVGEGDGEVEDVDEDEMLGLCVRGASPTVETDFWSKKRGNLPDPNWKFNENSDETDFDEKDDDRRRKTNRDRKRPGNGGFKGANRDEREIRKRLQMKRKIKRPKDIDNEAVCTGFLKGNCTKGNDCKYSHAVIPVKKMELCKFYLMDCCAKRDECLYLHEEFPCKFFHTGLKCYAGRNCKFSHEPLNSVSKDILLKHLETAPKKILGDFPRLSRESAESLVNNTSSGSKNADSSKIPSLFDIQVSIPAEFKTAMEENGGPQSPPRSPTPPPPRQKPSPVKTKAKEKPKFVKEPEQEEKNGKDSPLDFAKELEEYKNRQLKSKHREEQQQQQQQQQQTGSVEKKHRKRRRLEDDNDENVGDEEEDDENEDGKKRKHKRKKRRERKNEENVTEEKVDGNKVKFNKKQEEMNKKINMKKSPVQVSPDGRFGGIKFKIINRKEIRNSTDSEKEKSSASDVLLPSKIEKPSEFLSSDDEKALSTYLKKNNNNNNRTKSDDEAKCEDVDQFGVEQVKGDPCSSGSGGAGVGGDETDENEPDKLIIETNDEEEQQPAVRAKEVVPELPRHLPKRQRELFLRIRSQENTRLRDERERRHEEGGGEQQQQQQQVEHKSQLDDLKREDSSGSSCERGKTPSPEPADENWYSSDDEEPSAAAPLAPAPVEDPFKMVLNQLNLPNTFQKTEGTVARSTTPPLPKPKLELTALTNLSKDLSKVNITELLSSIRQVTAKKTQQQPQQQQTTQDSTPEQSPSTSKQEENKDPRVTRDPRFKTDESPRRTSVEKLNTIYDNGNFKLETKDSDLRYQTKLDTDERIPINFGDVDLRTKLNLPFKPVPVHSAATEIDGSLTSHPPISYRVTTIDIPIPDFSSIKISQTDPQVKKDPRLRRLFRLSSADEEQKKPSNSNLPTDPRRKIADTPKSPPSESTKPDILGGGLFGANFLALLQLGVSAATGATGVFDPRLQSAMKAPQELEALRTQLGLVGLKPADFDLLRTQLTGAAAPGLLPTPNIPPAPTGMGLLGPAPGFMMNPMGMAGPMGPGPMNFPNVQNFNGPMGGGGCDDEQNDSDMRMFPNRGFRGGGAGGDRRGGRGGWRGRDRNWDNRRHNRDKRDDRQRHKNREDRRERRRSNSPPD